MNTADIKDDSGRQIDYESFLGYKQEFNDSRTLNFTSSEYFNDKRAQREDEFYDKAESLYKNLPKGWKLRAKILEKDLIETPKDGIATLIPDEFFNVWDKTGPGMTNYKP